MDVPQEMFKFDAILTRQTGTIRHFIFDFETGKTVQRFPVVFDSGSDLVWLISDEHLKSLGKSTKGYCKKVGFCEFKTLWT